MKRPTGKKQSAPPSKAAVKKPASSGSASGKPAAKTTPRTSASAPTPVRPGSAKAAVPAGAARKTSAPKSPRTKAVPVTKGPAGGKPPGAKPLVPSKPTAKAAAGKRPTTRSGKPAAARPTRPQKTAQPAATRRKPVGGSAATAPGAIKPARRTIPALLLEGDHAPSDLPSGPGARYVLGLKALATTGELDDLPLPESYGTRKLWLVPRDPQWVYARWDLNREQLQEYNQLSRDGHLLLRVYDADSATEALSEVHVHPESRSWFVHVGRGGGSYFAVLGFRDKMGEWHEVSRSRHIATPPDSLSEELEAQFVNIPGSVRFTELIQVIRDYVAGEPALVERLEELRDSGWIDLPELPPPAEFVRWSPAQQQALAEVISMDEVRQVWAGSHAVTELAKGRREQELASISAVPVPAGAVGAPGAVSSPMAIAPAARSFWFNVNAELVVYGATDPNATVTIGGRPIRLRKDGTFSYRFALPDGEYSLPIAAISPDEIETRVAEMSFSRETGYSGQVDAHPQDGSLRVPAPENAA